MGTTPKYAFPYPEGTDRVTDGDNAIKALAERQEAVLDTSVVSHAGPLLGAPAVQTAAASGNWSSLFSQAGVAVPAGARHAFIQWNVAAKAIGDAAGSCRMLAGPTGSPAVVSETVILNVTNAALTMNATQVARVDVVPGATWGLFVEGKVNAGGAAIDFYNQSIRIDWLS